ncbi:ArsR family transcriptional regulator [Elioraea sp.]|uniref:VpaChn25_0724 family phage protein n=1 Tax=Elioraea sp. TaxID=2185103 RepID=UPI0025BB2049|nr:ArsR family transcriptional regulator [Elioraea sp.]
MSSYTEAVAADRRLSLLILIEGAPGATANEALLQSALDGFGHMASSDQVRVDLAWLAEQGLVTTRDTAGLVVATLTERGGDVALGRATVPGVKRRRPGT